MRESIIKVRRKKKLDKIYLEFLCYCEIFKFFFLLSQPSSNFLEIPPFPQRPRPNISRNSFFLEIHVAVLYKQLAKALSSTTISVSTFVFRIYFHRLFSMANYMRASGEAQASNFETLSSLEFYSNQRESLRLCVTAVR